MADFTPLTHYHPNTAQQRMQRHREDEVHWILPMHSSCMQLLCHAERERTCVLHQCSTDLVNNQAMQKHFNHILGCLSCVMLEEKCHMQFIRAWTSTQSVIILFLISRWGVTFNSLEPSLWSYCPKPDLQLRKVAKTKFSKDPTLTPKMSWVEAFQNTRHGCSNKLHAQCIYIVLSMC